MTTSDQVTPYADAVQPAPPSIMPMFATPCYGGMLTLPYFGSVLDLAIGMTRQSVPFVLQTMGNESLIPRARNNMLARFLASTCTHLFFIDADIGFRAQDAVDMILSDLDIVCGAYPTKSIEWARVAGAARSGVEPEQLAAYSTRFALNMNDAHAGANEFPAVERDGKVFIECKEASTGFMCIKRSVVERMIAQYPERRYFADTNGMEGQERWDLFGSGLDPMPVDPEHPRYLSEDYFFIRLWQRMGGKAHVYLGAKLTHTGTFTFEGDFGSIFKRNSDPVPVPIAAE